MRLICDCGTETKLEYDASGSNDSSGKEYIDYYNLKFDKTKFSTRRSFIWHLKQTRTSLKCRVCGDELCLGALK